MANLHLLQSLDYDVHPDEVFWIVVLGAIIMAAMAFLIGANDMANVLATSIGSKALKLWQASILGAIFVTIGATFLGSQVSSSIRNDIININIFEESPTILMYGMLCSLIAASLWLYLATRLEWPVSTTHSITGALLGFGLSIENIYGTKDESIIDWPGVTSIVISWVTSPLLTAILAAIIFTIIRFLFLNRPNSDLISKNFLGVLLFVLGEVFIISIFMDTSLKLPFSCNQGEEEATSPCILDDWFSANVGLAIGIATIISLILAILGYLAMIPWIRRVMIQEIDQKNIDLELETVIQSDINDKNNRKNIKKSILINVHAQSYKESQKAVDLRKNLHEFSSKTEKFFSVLQVLSACFDTLSLGASDIANAVGPFATIISIYNKGIIQSDVETPMLLLFIGGIFIGLGIIIMGYHVVKTLGIKLVSMSPSRGFCIEMSSSLILLIFANAGIPLSSTHCQVGATVGVGMCEPRDPTNHSILHKIFGKSVNWSLFGFIIFSWIMTIVVAAALSAAIFSFGAYAPSILTI